MSESAENHRVAWEATGALGEGVVTELTGAFDHIDDVGVKTAVIAPS